MLFLLAALFLQPAADRYRIDAVTINQTHIVFAHAGDLWQVSRAGGVAMRLTDLPGYEGFPSFSPDGRTLAFSGGASTGATDVFLMPAAGGETTQLTFHQKADNVRGWSPDGRTVLFNSSRTRDLQSELYAIDRDGVFPAQLPLPTGTSGSYAPDGQRMAYTPDLLFSNWQHYRGGILRDIDLVDLSTSTRIGAIPRTDSYDAFPMWIGEAVYFVSDRGGTHNLFKYDLDTKKVTPCTTFERFGVTYAAAGPDGIAMVVAGQIPVYDLATGQTAPVDVTFAEDAFPAQASKRVKIDGWLDAAAIGTDAGHLAFEARGEVLTLDAATGAVKN